MYSTHVFNLGDRGDTGTNGCFGCAHPPYEGIARARANACAFALSHAACRWGHSVWGTRRFRGCPSRDRARVPTPFYGQLSLLVGRVKQGDRRVPGRFR